MKKNIKKTIQASVLIVAILSLVLPVVSSSDMKSKEIRNQKEQVSQNQPNLVIDEISGGFGVTVVITNTGDAEAEDVTWTIDLDGEYIITGGYTLPPLPVIPSIPAGESIVIRSIRDRFIFGFGETNIDVTVSTNEGVEINKTVEGFAFGFYIGITEE
jgi:hypothetical protein